MFKKSDRYNLRKTEFYSPISFSSIKEKTFCDSILNKIKSITGRRLTQNLFLGMLGVITAFIVILIIGYAAEQFFNDSSSQIPAIDSITFPTQKDQYPENGIIDEQPLDSEQPVDAKPPNDDGIQGKPAILTTTDSDDSAQETIPDMRNLPTPTPIPRTPGSSIIESVPSTQQDRTLNCEFISASDLATYYGHSISWQSIFMAVGFDPNGNPNMGFVGKSVDDAPRQLYPNGYGVYAEPIARGLKSLGLDAQAFHNMGIEWLKLEIKSKHPVIVWAPFDMETATVTGWYTADGETWVKAVRGEHTFTIFGYNETGVYANDPWYGQERFFTWSVFERAWNYLNQMAVSVQPDTQ